ncbi:glycosyltransferase family 2 protein [bacterium]|nr:glycosyltransferase family 2 protein [bacterium]MCB2179273.1 glycosyltransferase family 2 protein [bacterium]
MNTPRVEVLLATYNGAAYLAEQLDSLLNQSHQDFRILVRDDGSTDETPAILHWYSTNYPNKIILISGESLSHGPTGNFSRLLSASAAPYGLFCDQDDIWQPDKISLSLEKMHELENQHGPNTPLLVYTDLEVVDQDLTPLAPSFFAFGGFNPERDTFHQLLVQNIITGCTILFNRALAKLATPMPPEAQMHDWWMALVASGLGEIGQLPLPTVRYRQHGQNTLGASRFNLAYIYRKAKGLWENSGESVLQKNFEQATAFQARYAHQLPPENKRQLARFIEMQTEGFIQRRVTCFQEGFTKGRFSQNIGLLLKL